MGPNLSRRRSQVVAAVLAGLALAADDPTAPVAPDRARLVVTVTDDAAPAEPPRPRPVRVIVTASDGSHPDGSGRGTYADGRFFADGTFTVDVPPGRTRIELRSGPDFEPMTVEADAVAGRATSVPARMHRWFAPEERGWYGADNHVHAQHDRTVAVRTDLGYTALQARADGLNYVTEADGGPNPPDLDRLSTAGFLLRRAPEIRPGPFVGHLNTPGLGGQIADDRYAALVADPLPVGRIVEEVHRRGGAVIHTHPLTPPHQLHWMGATEMLSDAVLGRSADALDLDGQASELLWFAVLNLGRRVAASSYTDCALGRLQTPSPGDRRVYVHADELSDCAVVAAIRAGRTFATNGGPVFPFLTLDGEEPGAVLRPGGDRPHALRAEIHSLHPLDSAQLLRDGVPVRSLPVAGRQGAVILTEDLPAEPADARTWYVLRVQDVKGHWAITSPIRVEPPDPAPMRAASALVLEVHNASRFAALRREFFAHLIVTVSPDDPLESVDLTRDGAVLHTFRPADGERRDGTKVPVTGPDGDYSPGWSWRGADAPGACHFQADWPVSTTGWYGLRARTTAGRTLSTESVRFDADQPESHALSVARLEAPGTVWEHRGYGEELPLAELKPPYEGDHWWYPRRHYWRVQATFGGTRRAVGGGDEPSAARFRPADGR